MPEPIPASQQVTFLTREIYDYEHSTSFFVKDHDELPGLLVLQYRDSIDEKIVDCTSFTVDQAIAVGKALIAAGQDVVNMQRRSLRADSTEN